MYWASIQTKPIILLASRPVYQSWAQFDFNRSAQVQLHSRSAQAQSRLPVRPRHPGQKNRSVKEKPRREDRIKEDFSLDKECGSKNTCLRQGNSNSPTNRRRNDDFRTCKHTVPTLNQPFLIFVWFTILSSSSCR